jgi:hypothetical protein
MAEDTPAVLAANLAALDRRMTDAFATRDKALDVALSALNEHLGTMNEFRGAMADQARLYITRPELEQFARQVQDMQLAARSLTGEYVPRVDMGVMTARIEALERQQTALQTRYSMIALVFSTAVVLANLLLVWWRAAPG